MCAQELQKIIESMGNLGAQLGSLKQAAAGAGATAAAGTVEAKDGKDSEAAASNAAADASSSEKP